MQATGHAALVRGDYDGHGDGGGGAAAVATTAIVAVMVSRGGGRKGLRVSQGW